MRPLKSSGRTSFAIWAMSWGDRMSCFGNFIPPLGHSVIAFRSASSGTGPLPEEFITRNAWGEVWGDPTIPCKTRSMITLAMMVALHREEEFKLHVRPALRNGVTAEELRSLLLHTAIYAGVPAANAAFRWVKDVLGDPMDQG